MLTALSLLDTLSLPAAALILGICFLRGIAILAINLRAGIECSERWRKDLVTLHGYWSHMYQARQCQGQGDELRVTCERALITLIGSAGGIPGSPEDDVGRQLVREVRKMYQEIVKPTPAPAPRTHDGHPASPQDDELDIDTANWMDRPEEEEETE